MATGRIGSTPVLRVRWSDQPAAGTTVLSGLDDNSVALVYDAGYEAVYRNGALLSRGNDYTATDGTTVTLLSATLAGDIIEIFANDLVPLTDAISKGQYTAKGALLSATAASTPGVLAVGTNNQVLTADSSTSTGLKWATPAGSLTLLSTTTLSGATTTISSISTSYTNLLILIENAYAGGNIDLGIQFNSDSGSNYAFWGVDTINGSLNGRGSLSTTEIIFNNSNPSGNQGKNNGYAVIQLPRYAEASGNQFMTAQYIGRYASGYSGGNFTATYAKSAAITSISLDAGNNTWTAGTVYIYGVK